MEDKLRDFLTAYDLDSQRKRNKKSKTLKKNGENYSRQRKESRLKSKALCLQAQHNNKGVMQVFKGIFHQDHKDTIDKILGATSFFPSFINQEGIDSLMDEITKLESKRVLHSFQNGKKLGSNSLAIEFYRDGLISLATIF